MNLGIFFCILNYQDLNLTKEKKLLKKKLFHIFHQKIFFSEIREMLNFSFFLLQRIFQRHIK